MKRLSRRLFLVGAAVLVVIALVLVPAVFAAGPGIANWVLRDRAVVAENFALGINGSGDRTLVQGGEEQSLASFDLWSVWGSSKLGIGPGATFAPDVGYSNLRFSWEREGDVNVRGLHLLIYRPEVPSGGTPERFESEALGIAGPKSTFVFLPGKAIEPTMAGVVRTEFRGIVQGSGKLRYTLQYDAVDSFGHIVMKTVSPQGTIAVVPKEWRASDTGELLTALDKALPGDKIILAKGVYNLVNSGTPSPAGVAIQGSGRQETLIIIGQPLASDSLIIKGVSLIQTTQEPAVISRYLVLTEAVVWSHGSWGVRLRGGDEEGSFFLRDNVFWGGGILLEVWPYGKAAADVVEDNVFLGQPCGVNISIDVVFSHIPVADRVAAYEQYAAALKAANTFVKADQPVCKTLG